MSDEAEQGGCTQQDQALGCAKSKAERIEEKGGCEKGKGAARERQCDVARSEAGVCSAPPFLARWHFSRNKTDNIRRAGKAGNKETGYSRGQPFFAQQQSDGQQKKTKGQQINVIEKFIARDPDCRSSQGGWG